MNSAVDKEYGQALYSLAEEEHAEVEILNEIRAIREFLTPEYVYLLSDPAIPKDERIGFVSEAFDGKINKYLANFLKLMTERNKAYDIKGCFREYENIYYDAFGIVRVKAESAVEINEEQRTKLQAKLEAYTGKIVEIEYIVRKDLVGGMRLQFAGRRIDETIKKKFRDIESRLIHTVV